MIGTRYKTLGQRAQAAALIAAIALGAIQPAAGATAAQDDAQLQKQLDDARGRLDDAARDVAELSQKLYGDQIGPILMGGRGSQGAMLGVNIGGGTDRAEGVEVMGISPAGPAESAGLKQGDIITAIDGKPLRKTDDRNAGRQLVDHLRGVQPGQKVKVDYLRDGKKLSTVVTTVAAEPPMFRALREHMPMLEGVAMALPPEFHEMMAPGGRGFRSLELVPLTPKLGQYFGADSGLLVVKAPANATGARLEEGDVILTIGGRTPDSARHAFRILGSYQPQEKVRIEVLRQRKRVALDVEMPEVGPVNLPLPAGFRPHVPPVPPAPPPPAARPATKAALLPPTGI